MVKNTGQYMTGLLTKNYFINCLMGTLPDLPISILSNSTILLLSSDLTPLIRNCCTILALPIESEIMDEFWRSRCLNDHIDFPNMIVSFINSATTSLVVKKGTKILFHYCINDCLDTSIPIRLN